MAGGLCRPLRGMASRSSTVKTSGLRTIPWINSRCLAGSKSGIPAWLLLIMQVRWRDRAHQLVQRRLRVDRVIWIDIAHARTRLGNTAELDVLRSLAVPANRGARLAPRYVRKRFGQSGPATADPTTPVEAAIRSLLRYLSVFSMSSIVASHFRASNRRSIGLPNSTWRSDTSENPRAIIDSK